jgi:hypothetical protein
MPLPVIADTIRTAVEGHCPNGHTWANVMHFRKSGALTFAGAEAILDPLLHNHYTVNSGAGSAWLSNAGVGYTMDQIRYTPLDGSTATSVFGHPHSGAVGLDNLPASVALVATLRTGLRGRSHRGRVYQNGWTEGANTPAGAPLAAGVTATLVQWQNFLTALGGSGVSLVVASYKTLVATDVASVTVDTIWDTQRRRLHA